MSFHSNLSIVIPASAIATKNNLSYLSAATAVGYANRPKFNFLDFVDADGNDAPFLKMLGGALVGVEIEQSPDVFQTMFLPVMDRDNLPMDLASISVSDVNNSRQRCLVKGIAAVTGVGMSVFLGCDGDGAKAAKLLKVEPSSDLADIEAVVATLADGGAPYIEWTYGLAAARTVDPDFCWNVVTYNGLPYREVLGSIQVDVTTKFKGKTLTLGLPVMDSKFNPIPTDKATVFDWNKTMMRALTKCIAFNSGYGLEIYADETEAKADAVARGGRSPRATAPKKDKSEAKAVQTAETSVSTPAPAPQQSQAEPDQTAAPAVQETVAASAPPPAPTAAADTPAVQTEAADDAAKDAPAPEAAAPKAEATNEGASKAIAEPTVSAGNQAQVDKFKGVMKKRSDVNGVEGLMTLFQALSISSVYSAAEKPDCFSTLVMGTIFSIEEFAGKDAAAAYAHVPALLQNIGEYGVVQMFNPDTRHLLALRLTALAFNAAVIKGDDKALTDASDGLIKAGIAEDVAHVFDLSQEATLSQETKDLLAAVLDAQTA